MMRDPTVTYKRLEAEQEQEEAFSRGSEQIWRAMRGYRIEGGVLKDPPEGESQPSEWRIYYPFAHPEIVRELAELQAGDEAAVVDFAGRWGRLHQDFALTVDGLLDRVQRDSSKWTRASLHLELGLPIDEDAEDADDPLVAGDRLTWIWSHAQGVRRLLQLITLVHEAKSVDLVSRNRAARELEERLEAMAVPPLPIIGPFGTAPSEQQLREQAEEKAQKLYRFDDFLFASGGKESASFLALRESRASRTRAWTQVPATEVAEELILNVINRNLKLISPRLSAPSRQRPRWGRDLSCIGPLPAIYWHLTDFLLGSTTYRQCRYCHRWFVQEHGGQRFCPRPSEDRKKGLESLCALRARKERSLETPPEDRQNRVERTTTNANRKQQPRRRIEKKGRRKEGKRVKG